MIQNLRVISLLVLRLLLIGSVPVTNAADPKVVNIGWTGGSSWTSLPDRVASEEASMKKKGCGFVTFSSRAPT
jgi:hypothetical protein